MIQQTFCWKMFGWENKIFGCYSINKPLLLPQSRFVILTKFCLNNQNLDGITVLRKILGQYNKIFDCSLTNIRIFGYFNKTFDETIKS